MKTKYLFACAVLGFAMNANANSFDGVLNNNKGVRNFSNKKAVEAYDNFTGALADLPFSSAVHYNLGNAYLENKEFEKAISEFNQALQFAKRSDDKEVEFRAHFNKAVALAELKKVDEALQSYQEALNLQPESVETKTNIELLTQSQQGGGGGEGEDKDQNKDQKDQGQGQQKKQQEGEGQDQKNPPKPQGNNNDKSRPKPKEFKSEELSQQDVKQILEELKRQEEQVRARMQEKGAKDAPPDKDW